MPTKTLEEQAAEIANSEPRIKITIEGFEDRPYVIENAKGFYLAADMGKQMQVVGMMRRMELVQVSLDLMEKIMEK